MGNQYGVNELVPTPMYPGFLRGYRTFLLCGVGEQHCLDHFDQVLHSVYMASNIHVPGINVAYCRKGGEHLAPAPHGPCTCGFYATHRSLPLEYLDKPVFAVIKATGRILLSDIGFRAEKVEIQALSVGNRFLWHDHDYTRLHALGQVFNVPTFEDPVEMLTAHLPQDLTGLIHVPKEDYNTWWSHQTLNSEQGPYRLLQEPGRSQRFVLIGPDDEVIDIPQFRRRLQLFDGVTLFTIERRGGYLLGTVERHSMGPFLVGRPVIKAE